LKQVGLWRKRFVCACPRCEILPETLPDSGTLYIVPPEFPTAGKLQTELADAGVAYETPFPRAYALAFSSDLLDVLCEKYFSRWSTNELTDTKCLILADGQQPSLQDLLNMTSMATFVARQQGGWLLELLEKERLVSFFQPIVDTRDPSHVVAYEALLRGRDEDGGLIPPFRLFAHAKTADLLFHLDRAARVSAIRCAHRQAIDSTIFINFTPTSVYDPEFCLRTTVAAIEAANLTPARIVFEVIESEQVHETGHLLKILAFYRDHGYRVALDDLGAGYGSLNLLHQLQPDFIKLDMDLVRNVHADPYKREITKNLLQLAKQLGVTSIAEGVETVDEWQWLAEHGADLIQGYLFAKPAEVPPIPHVPVLA
jgi:EAL domain-containing protein (putative c-di-GMP-specific phosphodiesterase class I)